MSVAPEQEVGWRFYPLMYGLFMVVRGGFRWFDAPRPDRSDAAQEAEAYQRFVEVRRARRAGHAGHADPGGHTAHAPEQFKEDRDSPRDLESLNHATGEWARLVLTQRNLVRSHRDGADEWPRLLAEMKSSSPELLDQGLMDLLMQTGDWLLEQGNTSNALSHYAAARAAWDAIGQPVSTSSLNLADRWSRLGRPEAAEAMYQAMGGGGLPRFALLMLRGWLALSCDQVTSAHALFAQAVEEAPTGDREALRACSEGLALAAYASGDLEGARECLPDILEDTLDRCMADEMGALFAFAPGEANALSIARCYLNIAESFFARGFWNQAIICYRRSLSYDPSSHGAWRSLGDAYLVQRLTLKSEECYRKAIDIRPEDARAHHYLGDALLKLHRLEDAISSVERALEIDPGYIEASAKLESLHRLKGLPSEEAFPDPLLTVEDGLLRNP